jgi:hypothetical protein
MRYLYKDVPAVTVAEGSSMSVGITPMLHIETCNDHTQAARNLCVV